MTGLMDKAIAKANKNEFDRYEKHYNTAYSVSKNNQLFSHCTLLSEIQIKNGLRMGSSIQAGMFVLTLLKLYQKFYAMM